MIRTIDFYVKKLENYLAILFATAIVGIVAAQVFFRYVLERPLSWSQEIATYLLIWLVTVGIVIAEREKENVAVKVVTQYLHKYDSLLRWIPWVSMAMFFLVFGYGGASISIAHSIDQSPITGLPLWAVFIAFPFMALLGLWHLALELPDMVGRKGRK